MSLLTAAGAVSLLNGAALTVAPRPE